MPNKLKAWLKENLSGFCGFIGTLAMSFAMVEGDGGQMKSIDPLRIDFNTMHHFIILKHPIWNQIGLMLIGISFVSPYFFKGSSKPRWIKWIIFTAISLLYIFLILRMS